MVMIREEKLYLLWMKKMIKIKIQKKIFMLPLILFLPGFPSFMLPVIFLDYKTGDLVSEYFMFLILYRIVKTSTQAKFCTLEPQACLSSSSALSYLHLPDQLMPPCSCCLRLEFPAHFTCIVNHLLLGALHVLSHQPQ